MNTCNSLVSSSNLHRVGIRNISDYSPFGALLPGRHSGDLGRFGFQGQEIDPEIKGEGNSVNYKYRMNDPRIGRFFAVDPLAPDYPHNSPYAFSENRVVDCIELEGLESMNVHIREYLDENGKLQSLTSWDVLENQNGKGDNGIVTTIHKIDGTTISRWVPETTIFPNSPEYDNKRIQEDEKMLLLYSNKKIREKYVKLKDALNKSKDRVNQLEQEMYGQIDGKIIHTDDGAYRKTTRKWVSGGGKRSGLVDGDVGNRIGKSITDYERYEKPLRREQKKMEKLKVEFNNLKDSIESDKKNKEKQPLPSL